MRSGCSARDGERVGAVGGHRNAVARALEVVARDLRDAPLIVHDQDVLHFGAGC
jgi:hypothetical protein